MPPHNIFQEALKKHFGYDEFRPGQEEIVRTIYKGKDTFVLMPTGGGKSLCFQLPALMLKGTAIVISPLIALMKDQVSSLRAKNIKAEFINSTVPPIEKEKIINRLKAGQIDLLYLSPEKLFWDGSAFLYLLQEIPISLFVIDEAHCISRWGYDFRPDYLKLARLKKHFPNTPIVALTATADKKTKEEIIEKLNLGKPKVFAFGFDRPNIYYHVQPALNEEQIMEMLEFYLRNHSDETGIVYTFSRLRADLIAKHLSRLGFSAKPYHAGLSREIRDKHQNLFMKGKIKIITATTAFGMGVDKSNIRFIFHVNPPRSIEDYYQETGRAGRDGAESKAILCYTHSKIESIRNLITSDQDQEKQKIDQVSNWQKEPVFRGNQAQPNVIRSDKAENSPNQRKRNIRKFEEMVYFCQSQECSRRILLKHFGEDFSDNCHKCGNCAKKKRKAERRFLQRIFINKNEKSRSSLSPV